MKSLALQDFTGAKVPSTAASGGEMQPVPWGPGSSEGSVQGRYSCRHELRTCSVQAVSCVQAAHSDLFVCVCGLVEGKFKSTQDLLGSFAPTWQTHSDGPIRLGRIDAVPTHRTQEGGGWQGPQDGGLLAATLTLVEV